MRRYAALIAIFVFSVAILGAIFISFFSGSPFSGRFWATWAIVVSVAFLLAALVAMLKVAKETAQAIRLTDETVEIIQGKVDHSHPSVFALRRANTARSLSSARDFSANYSARVAVNRSA